MTRDFILDHPLISQRYFFPLEVPLASPLWVDTGQARLACHLHSPHPGARTLVHFHGNGETVSDYLGDFLRQIEALGLNCLLAEYRGYGLSSGDPQLGAMLDDVEPILDALGQPADRLIVMGRSVGSIYAVHAAARRPGLAGLILESGIADVHERLRLRVHPDELGVSAEAMRQAVRARLDHQRKLADFQGATLVLHTRRDELVDVSHAERLHAWAPQPRSMTIFERGGHNTIMFDNHRAYFEAIAAFIRELGH